jgi:energy-converting hydrogenase Eha subunit A
VRWFRGDGPGDTRPEIIVVTILAGLIALAFATELVALLLGLRAIPAADVVDTWEPSVFATMFFVPVQAVLVGLLLLFRRGASTSTRRLARWSVAISCLGILSLVLDHVLISNGVWGYLKLF